MSVPSIVTQEGIITVLEADLVPEEREALAHSATVIRDAVDALIDSIRGMYAIIEPSTAQLAAITQNGDCHAKGNRDETLVSDVLYPVAGSMRRDSNICAYVPRGQAAQSNEHACHDWR